ncbi:hypothetical protein [Microcoleus sp. bin38.metabat.b11b12b14.051]|uniref:hypothetical protein n=1 Tax=Microcoleus sp. bin38.metabat.b11b12b14.051 TaxID=2742709 RepID=UPI0025F7B644|nr:hypothetical protein [Microcoleus sp. bin38.metabat.b11b12b14.051]
MIVHEPRYSKEEFAKAGDEIYESQVRPQVETGDRGKIVAIDIQTAAFEVDASEIAACDRLEARHPDAQIWIVRIGSRHVRRAGVVDVQNIITIPAKSATSC